MKLSDTNCILYYNIFIRWQFAAGNANWKHSHCLVLSLGRLAGNIKLSRGLSHLPLLATSLLSSFQKPSPTGKLLASILPKVHPTVPWQLVSVFWENGVMKRFGSTCATTSQESCKKGNWPCLELQDREEARFSAHLALAATEQQQGEQGFPDVHPKVNHNTFPKQVISHFCFF